MSKHGDASRLPVANLAALASINLRQLGEEARRLRDSKGISLKEAYDEVAAHCPVRHFRDWRHLKATVLNAQTQFQKEFPGFSADVLYSVLRNSSLESGMQKFKAHWDLPEMETAALLRAGLQKEGGVGTLMWEIPEALREIGMRDGGSLEAKTMMSWLSAHVKEWDYSGRMKVDAVIRKTNICTLEMGPYEVILALSWRFGRIEWSLFKELSEAEFKDHQRRVAERGVGMHISQPGKGIVACVNDLITHEMPVDVRQLLNDVFSWIVKSAMAPLRSGENPPAPPMPTLEAQAYFQAEQLQDREDHTFTLDDALLFLENIDDEGLWAMHPELAQMRPAWDEMYKEVKAMQCYYGGEQTLRSLVYPEAGTH